MLVLASKSPRRKQLLRMGGWDFVIRAGDVDESVIDGERPETYVLRLAVSKAHAALALLSAAERPSALILAADTTVVDEPEGAANFQILGKPADAIDAEAMLRSLRGRVHRVYSGLALLRAENKHLESEVVRTDVWMRSYSDAEIAAYIRSGDPMDKAGAYGIQHDGFHAVERLDGCYPNVMGLPLCRVSRLLAESGLPPSADIFDECALLGNEPCRAAQLARESAGDG